LVSLHLTNTHVLSIYDFGEQEPSLSKLYLPVSGQCLGDMTALGQFT